MKGRAFQERTESASLEDSKNLECFQNYKEAKGGRHIVKEVVEDELREVRQFKETLKHSGGWEGLMYI